MLREIKFRVWDVRRKVLANVTSIMWLSEDEIEIDHDKNGLREPFQIHGDTAILEQFTGLHDSTTWKELTEQERKDWLMKGHMPSEWRGREVYEGDILQGDDDIEDDVFHVARIGQSDENRYECFLDFNGDNKCWMPFITCFNRMKIIGSIHDNPELLGGK